MTFDRFESLLKSEMICWYQADELPPAWSEPFMAEEWPRRARLSATRLAAECDRTGLSVPGLAEHLLRLAEDRGSSFYDELERSTMIDWRDEENWPAFRELLRHIAAAL